MGVKNIIGGTFEDIGEAVVKPVIAEVGHMIETGLQTKTPSPQKPKSQTPSDPKSSQVDQTKMLEARRKIKYWKDLSDAQRKIREEAKQRQFQKTQVVEQESQVKDLEVIKKKEDFALKMAQRKTEIRGGVGG